MPAAEGANTSSRMKVKKGSSPASSTAALTSRQPNVENRNAVPGSKRSGRSAKRGSPSAVRPQCGVTGSSSPSSVPRPATCAITCRSVTGQAFRGNPGTDAWISSSSVNRSRSTSRPTAADVSGIDAVPMRNGVSGDTGRWSSRLAQPNPSAHTTWPPRPTATDTPGKFCSARLARTSCRARSTASAQRDAGASPGTDVTARGSGWIGFAVAIMNAHSPRIAMITPTTPKTITASQLSRRFFAATVPPASTL
ncbi:MAG: hypothetical protein R2752_15780 [Vicinamibacterales bacterium]